MATIQPSYEYAQAEFGRDFQAEPRPSQDDLWEAVVLALNGQQLEPARAALEDLLAAAHFNGTHNSIPLNLAGLSTLADALECLAKEVGNG